MSAEQKYHNLYQRYRKDVIEWDEREQFLLGEIERLELDRWRGGEMTSSELYLVDKIDQLESELRQKDDLLKAYETTVS